MAEGRARQHRFGRRMAVEVGEDGALHLDFFGRVLLDKADSVQRGR